jgi:hypothetical protein
LFEAKIFGITGPQSCIDNQLPTGLMLAAPDRRGFGARRRSQQG